MEGVAYEKFVASYIGIIMVMLKLIAMVAAIGTLIFLKVHREKIDRASAYVFQTLLWLILIYSLAYTIGGIVEGTSYWLLK